MAGLGFAAVVSYLALMAVVDPRTELLRSQRGTVKKEQMTPRMGHWKIEQLTQIYKNGILDRQDFVDARAKIVDKIKKESYSLSLICPLDDVY